MAPDRKNLLELACSTGLGRPLNTRIIFLTNQPIKVTKATPTEGSASEAWPASIQAPCPANPQTENLQVIASHLRLGLSPRAWWAVAYRLSQPEDRGSTSNANVACMGRSSTA